MGQVPRIIICAGMSRSAGTLQYQIVSEMVRLRGLGDGVGFPMHLNVRASQVQVVKSEPDKPWLVQFAKDGTAKVVSIHRDFRDVVASLVVWCCRRDQARGIDAKECYLDHVLKHEGKDALRWIKGWEEIGGVYMARYEDYYPRKWWRMAMEMSEFLSIDLSSKEAKQIASKFTITRNRMRMLALKKWMDGRGSMLTQHHISGNSGRPGTWKTVFDDEDVMSIEAACGDWLEDHGYKSKFESLRILDLHADR